ncbi:hypothetical protein [Corynebacterium sp.]|uniref:hypothetical protein n=1 Tax=Corynebacterium sp. TaxID=1720 RepID=UPI0026DB985E|nr:hypothetical protein [Corynebacterium sp.]MDO5076374.1 hypothetical protein [Corynebacterium sp.]
MGPPTIEFATSLPMLAARATSIGMVSDSTHAHCELAAACADWPHHGPKTQRFAIFGACSTRAPQSTQNTPATWAF